jgi:hypothetical protein
MTDIIISLNNKSEPIPIKYVKNNYGFSDPNINPNKYLFELIIYGENIGMKYFRNLEDNKYSDIILSEHKIKLSNINTYKLSVSIYPTDNLLYYELEGEINKEETYTCKLQNNLYIEFSQNKEGYVLCSCFYKGTDANKIFATPPN